MQTGNDTDKQLLLIHETLMNVIIKDIPVQQPVKSHLFILLLWLQVINIEAMTEVNVLTLT